MAVIIRKKVIVNGKEVVMTPVLGEGKITKNDVEKARKLDKYLEQKMKQVFNEMKKEKLLDCSGLKKWHGLGKKLCFVDNKSLINAEDVNNGYIWQAIRQYCPVDLLPRGTEKTEIGATTKARREGKRYDHLHHCYECGKYNWKDISWVGNWVNWIELVESPGLIRDRRVIFIMKEIINLRGHPLTQEQFRIFTKYLRKFFSTKGEYRDTSGISDAEIKRIITKFAKQARIID